MVNILYNKIFVKSILSHLIECIFNKDNFISGIDSNPMLFKDVDLNKIIEDPSCPSDLKEILITYEYIIFDFTEAYMGKKEFIETIRALLSKI